MPFQNILLIALPLVTPFIGSSLAAILAQDSWPVWLNDGIAWFVLLAASGLDMWANSQFSGGWITIVADGVQTMTLLSSGWLIKLKPWLTWLNFLQANVFNLVPLFEDALRLVPGKQTVTTRAVPPSVPTPIILPPGSSSAPPRASVGEQEPS
jgi:hypothetical protein